MITKLYFMALLVLPLFGSCQKSEPEPDFSGLQSLSYTVQQTNATSTNQLSTISFAPNPFAGSLRIYVYNPGAKPGVVYLSDEKGKYSKKIELNSTGVNSIDADFSNMPKGVYICEVNLDGQVSRHRLLKAR